MITKTITYTDYNGRERTERFYFNLDEAEVIEMELSEVGGMRQLIELMIEKQNVPEIIKNFKNLLARSYGEKSADGKRFIKSPELSNAFFQTRAYSKLFTELLNNADSASAFLDGLMPEEMVAMAQQAKEEAKLKLVEAAPEKEEDGSADQEKDASLLTQI